MSGTREGTYGNEFHRGLLATFKDKIGGTKTHGSLLQKRGQPDYVYYADQKTFGAGYIGIEFKFIPHERVPKRCEIDLEKLLRPDQRFILHDINEKGQIGLQATVIELVKRKYICLFHTVSMTRSHFFTPSKAYLAHSVPAGLIDQEDEYRFVSTDDMSHFSGMLIMIRSSGKGLLLYNYNDFASWLQELRCRR